MQGAAGMEVEKTGRKKALTEVREGKIIRKCKGVSNMKPAKANSCHLRSDMPQISLCLLL